MSDLIDRQAAIEAIRKSTEKYNYFMGMEEYTDEDAIEAIKAVPSAQREVTMAEKLKPVRCGCGGEAVVCNPEPLYATDIYRVECTNCFIVTPFYSTESAAIDVWNRAMGVHTTACTTERTAKVEDKYRDYLPYSRFMESELKGDCGFCGETVWLGEKYCHECGTKLDWSGNE